MKMLLYICLLLLGTNYLHADPTQVDVDRAETDIEEVLEDNSGTVRTRVGRNNYDLKNYPYIAGFVRLAFHDCAGDGKCDGCLNYDLSSNNGLSTFAGALDAVYDADATNYGMSRADFYAFASIVALELSTSKMTNANEQFDVRSTFKFGRVDCATSPTTDTVDPFPSGHDGYALTIQYFSDNFGFTATETFALLGAHSLGRAKLENSGFEGRWTDAWVEPPTQANPDKLTPESTLDNQYYREINIPWKQLENTEGNFQWHTIGVNTANDGSLRDTPRQPTILLNCDFSFKWLYTGNETNGFIDCSTNCPGGVIQPFDSVHDTCCQRSPVQTAFTTLLNSNEEFITQFEAIFVKMVNRQFTDSTGTIYADLESEKRDPLDKYSTEQLQEILDELMASDK